MGHLAQGVGARRGDQHHIRPSRQVHMVVPSTLAGAVDQFGQYRPSAERGQGQWGHEVMGRPCHHHLHMRTGLHQFPNKYGGFIRGNASGHAQEHFAGQRPFDHGGGPFRSGDQSCLGATSGVAASARRW